MALIKLLGVDDEPLFLAVDAQRDRDRACDARPGNRSGRSTLGGGLRPSRRSVWRRTAGTRAIPLNGRLQIVVFLARKWVKELNYRYDRYQFPESPCHS
jgi:nuclear transport factor 2 (NTF2) superfamily protein